MDSPYHKIGETCPHCKEGKLEYCPANEPWSDEHLICGECYSTYLLDKDQYED